MSDFAGMQWFSPRKADYLPRPTAPVVQGDEGLRDDSVPYADGSVALTAPADVSDSRSVARVLPEG